MDDLHPIQVEILRNMDPLKKLEIMHALINQAWRMRWQGEKHLHPEWSEDQVHAAVRDSFLYGRT